MGRNLRKDRRLGAENHQRSADNKNSHNASPLLQPKSADSQTGSFGGQETDGTFGQHESVDKSNALSKPMLESRFQNGI